MSNIWRNEYPKIDDRRIYETAAKRKVLNSVKLTSLHYKFTFIILVNNLLAH